MFQEIDSLRVFLAVCEMQSIRKGAEKLNLTQPAVSRRIQKLEEELNVQLFDRKSHGIELTQFGTTLYQCSTKIHSLCSDTRMAIQEQLTGQVGELRIGAGHAWCNDILPSAIVTMTERFPAMKIELTSGLNGITMKLLSDEKLDVVIGTLEPDYGEPSQFAFTYLKQINMHIYSSTTHPLAGEKDISLSELINHAWISLSGSSIGQHQINRYFENDDIVPPSSVVETTSLQTAIKLLESGKFIMILPDLLGKDLALKNIFPLNLTKELWSFSAGLTYRNNGLKYHIIEKLAKCLRELLNIDDAMAKEC